MTAHMAQDMTQGGAQTVPRLTLRGIRKVYPSVVANDGIDLTVMPGEIHAVLGENGAGKSTLMKIIYGVTQATEGEIAWEGRPVRVASPAHARSLGIGMVFQHFSLFETLTVAENVALSLPGKPDLEDLAARIRAVSARYGLPVGERQRVEIIRCLLQNPRVLIMDEPTSVLTPQAVRTLFATLRHLAPARGGRLQHPVHQPQAGRDPRAVPPGHGAARREGHGRLHAGGGVAGLAGAPDDRQGAAQVHARRRRRCRRGASCRARTVAAVARSVRHRAARRRAGCAGGRDRRHRRRVRQRQAGTPVRAVRRGAARRPRHDPHLRHRRRPSVAGPARPARSCSACRAGIRT